MHALSTSRSGSTSTEEGTKEAETLSGPAPDGGLRAWLVVFGGFLTYFATFGITVEILLTYQMSC